MASPIIKAHFFLYLPLIKCLIILQSTAVAAAVPNCRDKCGNINIPFPFGTSPDCRREGFNITCDNSTIPPKAFLGSNPATSIELKDINITSGEARVYNNFGYRCYNKIDHINESFDSSSMNLTDLPIYLFSSRRNKFTAIGCLNMAFISGIKANNESYFSGCTSYCESLNSTTENGTCNGLGCCQSSITEGLTYYQLVPIDYNNSNWQFNPCMYSMLVEEEWYTFRRQDLRSNDFLMKNQKRVPLVLDWAIRDSGTCHDGVEESSSRACLSRNSTCNNTINGVRYLCQCLQGFEGNPYVPDGCQDINECNFPNIYPCHGNCRNTEGSYKCSCKKGTKGNPKIANCTDNFPLRYRVAISCILGAAVLLGVCVLLVFYQQHKKHMKEKEEYNRYYQMMDNHLRVFSKKQIENATDNYNDDHVIGRGGQGNMYQGLLDNNQVVAIKKAKEVDETQRGEFVNEIILLSQINHKNIVRLLGCCLEVKIPMLVYEFLPNRTLFEFLHRNSRRTSISLGTRLKIVLDSAVALDYLHTSISCSIIHGDVKSANILLDADYTAKVSDFGASSAVPKNEIVELVHFSHGYVDPECFYTEIITKKSDVYSFGVVLLEILTRKEAVYKDEKGEKQPLATTFISKARKNEHHEMLDVDIVTDDENVMKVLEEICEIALQCLRLKGDDRPTMEQVADELQKLVRFHNSSSVGQIDQGEMESSLGKFRSNSTNNIVKSSKSVPKHRGEVD